MGGTGFLHRSGIVLTAAHVVKGCTAREVVLLNAAGQDFAIASIDADDALDLALLKPSAAIPGQALSIAPVSPPEIGMQVATWGYPGGYSGLAPLLSVGYLAGTQEFKEGNNPAVLRWVVNAAFNGGNSGGPVLSLEDGSIIGVVSSKLAPIPQEIAQILEVLQKQQYGLQYNGTKSDGTAVTYSEGQLIGEVLQYLRGQVQLVIGYSIAPEDISKFLKARKIDP
jgi:S1-C subfamily serine protease